MTTPLPPREVLHHYFTQPEKVVVTTLGQGNINDTFLAESNDRPIVLQRINDTVFPVPQLLISNLHYLSQHLPPTITQKDGRRWENATLVPALDGSLSIADSGNKLWRAMKYISNSRNMNRVTSSHQAEQMGWALGHFHNMLSPLDSHRIQTVLPGFHNISVYLEHYDRLSSSLNHDSIEIEHCTTVIQQERSAVLSLQKALKKGDIHQRLIHGDPKIDNVLFDKDNNMAVSIIDLDTVGPGLLQHDIGDCLRSVCNTAGEGSDPAGVRFDLDICSNTLTAYLREAEDLLTEIDRELIYDGLRTITFELGLRFFTDYLQGGAYFKCDSPKEILQKALVQFSLLQDIIAKESAIRQLALS